MEEEVCPAHQALLLSPDPRWLLGWAPHLPWWQWGHT